MFGSPISFHGRSWERYVRRSHCEPGGSLKSKLIVGRPAESAQENWTSRTIDILAQLEQDKKHLSLLSEDSDEVISLRKSARSVLKVIASVRLFRSPRALASLIETPSIL